MKITNARAGVVTDYDNTDDSKPTLKKRQPEGSEAPVMNGDPGSSSSSDGPPKLKKRDQPDPPPTPTPQP